MTIDPTPIIKLLEKYIEGPLDVAILAATEFAIAVNPTGDEAAIVAGVDGGFKHGLRSKLALVVDIIWPFVQPQLDMLIAAAYAEVKADPTSPANLPSA